MSASLLPNAKSQFLDQNGRPLAAGQVYFYIPNTSTKKDTYQDSAQTILNTNPVVLDMYGQAIIWGNGTYRQVVYDQNGNLIWDQITQDANASLTGGITDKTFVAGTDFTPGTTTQLTLPINPGSIANTWIFFDAAYQGDDQVSLSGNVLTFNSPIPLGIQEVNVKMGTTVAIGTPGPGTITDVSVAANAGISSSKLLYNQGSTGAVNRTVQNRLQDFVSVMDFGAKGDGVADDTAAWQAALNNVKTVYAPQGTYKITSALNVPPGVLIIGAGIASTTITQQTLTADGFIFNSSGQNGGGIFGITLTSNAPTYNSRGSSGVGILVNQSNQGFTIRDVCISNFDCGLEMNNCFSEMVENIIIQYFGSRGIFIPEGTGYTSNDGRYIGIKIHNINNTWGDQSSVGILIQLSGGHFFTNIDVISTGYGLILQPPSDGPTIAYAQFVECLFDTPYSHAVFIDGTYGSISAIEFDGCWAAYSTAGNGVHILGSGTNGISWQGGRIRENGFNGVSLVGGQNIQFNGSMISQNSKGVTNTFDGVLVDAGVSNWQVLNCQIGNFASGLTTKQRYGINIQTGASNNYVVVNNGFIQNQTGGLIDNGTGTNKIVSPNLTY